MFDIVNLIFIEEQLQNHDQIPVAKKYEMLGDRDATKLKLELEGGEKREKKDVSTSETNVSAEDKDSEEKKEEMETSSAVEESIVDSTTADQSIKEESSINKDGPAITYDPNVAIGNKHFD